MDGEDGGSEEMPEVRYGTLAGGDQGVPLQEMRTRMGVQGGRGPQQMPVMQLPVLELEAQETEACRGFRGREEDQGQEEDGARSSDGHEPGRPEVRPWGGRDSRRIGTERAPPGPDPGTPQQEDQI